MGTKEKAGGEEKYLKGRQAGVEETQGVKRKGTAEKTIFPGERNSDGGGEDGLGAAAHSIYEKAVHNSGDSIGDKALTER